MTGSTPLKQRKEMIEKIASGDIHIIIGTHALFQKDIDYYKLGIVIAEKNISFGVR